MAKNTNLTLTELIGILNNSDKSLNEERLRVITQGKSTAQKEAINRAATIDFTDAEAIEHFVRSVRSLGFDTKISKTASASAADNITIKFIPDNVTENSKIKSFDLTFSADRNGHIIVNGMPSINTLVTGLTDDGNVTLSTATSAMFRNYARLIDVAKIKASLNDKNTAEQRIKMLRWINKTAKKNTLSSAVAYNQSREIEDLLNETIGVKSSNPARVAVQKGDVNLNGLITAIVNRNKNLFLDHFKKESNVYITKALEERYLSRAETDIATVLQLYAVLGPEQANKILPKDFKYLMNNSSMNSLLKSVGSQINSWGARQAHLSDTNAMRMLGLNEPLIAGKDWFLESSRKTMQTLLTRIPLSMINKNKKKTPLSGGIFKSAAFKELGIDDAYGDFDLQGRVGSSAQQVKQGWQDFKKYIIDERNKHRSKNQKRYDEKAFNREFGEVLPTVDVDALLYSDRILRDFDPYLPKTSKIKAQDIKKYFENKGWDLNKYLTWLDSADKNEKKQARSAFASAFKQSDKIKGNKNPKDFKFDKDAFNRSLTGEDEFFDVAYRIKNAAGNDKYVTPGATYRESGMSIPEVAMAFMQRAAGLNPKQIFGVGFNGTFEEGIAELSKGSKSKVKLHSAFLYNKTTGTSDSKIGRTLDAKSIGDQFTGLIKEIGYSQIEAGLLNGKTRHQSLDFFRKEFARKILEVSKPWENKDGYKGMYKDARNLAKRVAKSKIFDTSGEDVSWYDRDASGRGFDTSKDFAVSMLALGEMYKNLYGLSESPIQIDDKKNIIIKDNVVLRHQEAQHMSAIYGAAEKQTSGYALSQGYREHAALDRLIKFVNPNGKKATNASGIERDITEWTNDYVDKMFIERTQYGKKYGAKEAARRLEEGQRIFDFAWNNALSEDVIKKIDENDKDGRKSLILNMADAVWKQEMEDLDYEDDGRVSGESFQNSFVGVLENEIRKFIAREYQQELGLKSANEWGSLTEEQIQKYMPRLYIKAPNGMVAQSTKVNGDIQTAGVMPLYYNAAEYLKDKNEYIVAPEQKIINQLISSFSEIEKEGLTGSMFSRGLGEAYEKYLNEIDREFEKGQHTYESSNKAEMSHTVMPKTHSVETRDIEGLENAIFLSKEDVTMMLTPTAEEQRALKDAGSDFVKDVLMPAFDDLYSGENEAYGKQILKEIDNDIKSRIKKGELKRKNKYAELENQIRERLVGAVTVGSSDYEKLNKRGLIAALNRYPSSMGRDIKAASLFVLNSLDAGEIGASQDLFGLIHADYDGDHGVVRLWFADGTVIAKHYSGEQNKALRNGIMETGRLAAEQQIFANKIFKTLQDTTSGYVEKKNTAIKNGVVVTREELNKLNDHDTEAKRTFLSKFNKQLTGSSSNLYQSFERIMYDNDMDDSSVAALQNGRAVKSSITRAFLESFVENAISAKKVDYKEGGENGWWNAANRILDDLMKEESWSDFSKNGKMSGIIDRMTDLSILKDKNKNAGGSIDNWIAGNYLILVAEALKHSAGRKAIAELFGIDTSNYEKDDNFEALFLKDLKAGKFKVDKSILLRTLGDTHNYLKGRGFEGGLATPVSDKYAYLPGVGTNFNTWKMSQNKIIPDEELLKRLHASGLIVDDNGVIRPGKNYTNAAREAQFTDMMVQQFTNKQRDLSDWASQWKENGGIKNSAENFEYLAKRALEGGYVARTSASSMKNAIFPAFGSPLPFNQFNKQIEELIKEGKFLYSEGVAENLGYDSTTFNLLRGSTRSTAMGHYIHARADLLISALAQGMEKKDENFFDNFITTYDDAINKELQGEHLNKKDVKTIFKNQEDLEIWNKYKDKIIDYAKNKREWENYLNIFTVDKETKSLDEWKLNKERENAQLRADALVDYLTRGGDNAILNFGKRNAKGKLVQDGNLIATEGNLLGSHRGLLDASRADIMFESSDAFTVMDYKNTKGGVAEASQIYQVLHYLKDIEELRYNLKKLTPEEKQDIIEGIFTDKTNPIYKLYKDKNFGGDVYFKDGKPTKAWEKLVTAAASDKSLKGRILSTDEQGFLRDYEINYAAAARLGYLEKIDAGQTTLSQEEIQGLEKQGILTSLHEEKIKDKFGNEFTSAEDVLGIFGEYTTKSKEAIKFLRELHNLQLKLRAAIKTGNEAEIEEINGKIDAKQKEAKLDERELEIKKLEEKAKGYAPETFANQITYEEMKEDEERRVKARQEEMDQKDHDNSYKQLKSLINQRTKLQASLYQNQVQYDMATGDPERMALEEQREVIGEQMNQIAENIQNILNSATNGKIREKLETDLQQLEGDAIINLNRRITNVNVQNRGQNTLWGQLGLQFNNMLQRFIKWGAASRIIQTIRRDIQKLVQSATQLDKAITNLRIVTGKNDEDASSLVTSYSNLANQLGATTTEVANSATAWIRQGYAMNEVTELVTASMYLSKLGMISSEEATKDLTSSLKAFKIEAMDAMSVVDKLTSLDINAATTAGEIANALQAFGVTASMNGLSIDQASAMAATIMDVSQAGASTVGNALKTILSRYGNVKAGAYTGMNPNYDNDETMQNINDIERVLSNIGISIRNSNLEFREFDDVLADVADRWITLDSVTQNAIATAFAGVRQRESFAVLINNMDKYNELLEVSQTSAGTAERKYKAYYESIEAYQKRLQAAWEKLANDANIRDFMKTVLSFTTGLVKNLPTILRYLTMFVTTTQGYKIPRALGAIGRFMNPLGVTARGEWKTIKGEKGLWGGLASGGWRAIKGEYTNKDIQKYYGIREGKMSPVSAEITNATNTVAENTIALNNNTAALRGETLKQSGLASGGTSSSVAGTQFKWALAPGIVPNSSGDAAFSNSSIKYRTTPLTADEEQQIRDMGLNFGKLSTPNMLGNKTMVLIPSGSKIQPEQEVFFVPKGNNLINPNPQLAMVPISPFTDKEWVKKQEELERLKKKNLIKAKGATGIASGVMASLTARKTVEVDGETYEMSSGAKAVSKTLSGVATGAGSLISPVIGMLAGAAADIISSGLGKWIDEAKISAEKARKERERQISTLQKTGSSFETLQKISESRLNRAEDLREMAAAAEEIRRTFNADENKSLKELLINNFNKLQDNQEDQISSLDAILDTTSLTAEEQEKRYYQLMLAEKMTETGEQLSQLSNEYADLGKEAAEASRAATGMGETGAIWSGIGTGSLTALGGAGAGVLAGAAFGGVPGAIMGAIVGLTAGIVGAIQAGEATYESALEKIANEEFGDKPIATQIEKLQDILDKDAEKEEKDRELSKEQRSIAENSLNQLKSIRQEMKANLEKQDSLKIQEAMLSAQINGQYLGLLSSAQKSLYGPDELFRSIASQLSKTGGFENGLVYNDENTEELSSYAYRMIRSELMKNEEYAKILKGEIYTIKDVYNLPIERVGESSKSSVITALQEKYGVESEEELKNTISTYYENAQKNAQAERYKNTLAYYNSEIQKEISATAYGAHANGYNEERAELRRKIAQGESVDYLSTSYGFGAVYKDHIEKIKQYQEQIEKINSKIGENAGSLDTGEKTLEELIEDQKAISKLNAENRLNQELRQTVMSVIGVTNDAEFKEKVKEFGDMTSADFQLTATQNVEKIKEINSMMSEIASSSKTWSEKTNDIVAKYPSLIKYANNADQLQKKLLDKTIQYSKLQNEQQFKSIITNQEYFAESFVDSLKEIKIEGQDAFTSLKERYKDFANVKDLQTLMSWTEKHREDAIEDVELINKLIEQEIGATQIVSDAQKELRNTLITYSQTLMDKEISNLQEQKQALSEITNQREYENKLIEAKIKLENAQKEKKRIWREGVGWVYEADQNAVADAQKELEQISNEKKISDLDLQITQMEADKKMLSDISREEELENQKAMFDAWVRKYNETSGSSNDNISAQFYSSLIDETSPLNSTINSVKDLVDQWKAQWEAKESLDSKERKRTWKIFTKARDNYKAAQDAYAASAASNNGQASYTATQNLTEARKAYNNALTDWKTAFNNSQNNGFTSAEDYTETDGGMNSTDAFEAGANLTEEYDNREEYWLPNYFMNGGSGWSQYSIDWDSNPVTASDKEFSKIRDDLESRVYHEAVVWTKGGESNPIDVDAEYGDRKFTDAERDSFYKNDQGLKTLLGKDQYKDSIIWTSEHGVWRVKGGNLYKMSVGGKQPESTEFGDRTLVVHSKGQYSDSIPASALGTLSAAGGLNLINELGTEAIITPQGTLTALPSKTGIIPADITGNLWQLGELAPSILRTMLIGTNNPQFNKNSQTVDESFNINGLNMTINADDTFDINRFVNAIKNQAALTKNK